MHISFGGWAHNMRQGRGSGVDFDQPERICHMTVSKVVDQSRASLIVKDS
jgi:hypothetical protein